MARAAVVAVTAVQAGMGAASDTPPRPAAGAAAPMATPTPIPVGNVRVLVTLTDLRGSQKPAADAAVWLPSVRAARPRAAGAAPRIAQRNKTFEPHVEVVKVGTAVAFPNFDRIYHNVFSLSEIKPFDLGLYRNGASRSLAFERPGVLRVYCNIHPDMAAFLVVVDSDHFGKTGADGTLELRDVPTGSWPLHGWHEKTGETQAMVAVGAGRTVTVSLALDGSRWRPLKHKNKYGKEYPPPDDDEDRY